MQQKVITCSTLNTKVELFPCSFSQTQHSQTKHEQFQTKASQWQSLLNSSTQGHLKTEQIISKNICHFVSAITYLQTNKALTEGDISFQVADHCFIQLHWASPHWWGKDGPLSKYVTHVRDHLNPLTNWVIVTTIGTFCMRLCGTKIWYCVPNETETHLWFAETHSSNSYSGIWIGTYNNNNNNNIYIALSSQGALQVRIKQRK